MVAGVLFAPALTALFAPGFLDKPDVYSQTSELVRITFPYLGLISLTAYAAALLNAHGYFALPAVTPVLLNVCLMLAAMMAIFGWVDVQPVVIVAWGVVVAGMKILQACRAGSCGHEISAVCLATMSSIFMHG